LIELDAIKTELGKLIEPLSEVKESLDLENKSRKVVELERQMEENDFWTDADKANAKVRELKAIKDSIETYQKLETQKDDIYALMEMAEEENDESLIPDIQAEMADFTKTLDKLRLETLLSDEYDANNAILRLNAGAGGTESCDWCSMLYRMYTRWADKHGFSV
jgi:peptide chain release factor 2